VDLALLGPGELLSADHCHIFRNHGMFFGPRIIPVEPCPVSTRVGRCSEITIPVRGNPNALPLAIPFLADLVHGKGGNLANFSLMFGGPGFLGIHTGLEGEESCSDQQ